MLSFKIGNTTVEPAPLLFVVLIFVLFFGLGCFLGFVFWLFVVFCFLFFFFLFFFVFFVFVAVFL